MLKRLLRLLGLVALAGQVACAQNVTLTGVLQAANGLSSSNYTLSLQPSQIFYIAGSSVVVNTAVFCATSTDGSVVGTSNPRYPLVGAVAYTGTLTPATYFVKYAWYDAVGNVTLPSPEQTLMLTGNGQLQLSPPTQGMPATATGMKVYISTTTGTETLQGQTVGSAMFIQSIPLVSGGALPSTNATICKVVANDAGWPTGTGYNVTFSDTNGNILPGYPMMWRLLGPNTTINLSNGLPSYNGLVTYPVPILATPYNHTTQSISGPLSLTNYNLTNVAALGVGTGLPAWGVDVEGPGLLGQINANGGYLVNGSGGTIGKCLGSDGMAYDVAIPCLTSTGTVYYQTVAVNSIPVAPVATLNFSSYFTVSNSGTQTNVDVPNTAVTPGSYTCMSGTVDAKGRLTAASTGSCTAPTFTGTSGYQTLYGGLILEWGTTGNFDTGPQSVSFPMAFPHSCLMKPQLTQDLDVSTTTRQWESGSCTTTGFIARNDGIGTATYFVIGW